MQGNDNASKGAAKEPSPDVKNKDAISEGIARELRRCYWVLLTADNLRFVYLCSPLNKTMGKERDALLGRSMYDFLHPAEEHQAKVDLAKFVESRSVHGAVTRCNYIRIHVLKNTLSGQNCYKNPELDAVATDDKWIACDVATSYISDNLILAFFHGINDFDPKKDNEPSSSWTNWCGCQEDDVADLIKGVSINNEIYRFLGPPAPTDESLPSRVWLTYESKSKQVLAAWPESSVVSLPNAKQHSTPYAYDPNYFVRLAQDESRRYQTSAGPTSCTRRLYSKHYVPTDQGLKIYECVVIPYGSLIFAVFDLQQPRNSPPWAHASPMYIAKPHLYPVDTRRTSAPIEAPVQGVVAVRTSPPAISPTQSQPYLSTAAASPANYFASDHLPSPGGGPIRSGKHQSSPQSRPSPTPSKRDALDQKALSADGRTKGCTSCGTTASPEWRRGPTGHKTLCNACGLRYARQIAREGKQRQQAAARNAEQANSGPGPDSSLHHHPASRMSPNHLHHHPPPSSDMRYPSGPRGPQAPQGYAYGASWGHHQHGSHVPLPPQHSYPPPPHNAYAQYPPQHAPSHQPQHMPIPPHPPRPRERSGSGGNDYFAQYPQKYRSYQQSPPQ